MVYFKEFISTLIVGFALSICNAAPMDFYDFSGPEIFPIDDSIGLLSAADLTGDGLNDLILADNEHYRIALLYNQTGKKNWADADPPASPFEGVNQLPLDARFRLDSIPVDEQISALAVADLNGDGRPDFVFFGDGKDLEVIYNLDTNGWSDPQRWHLDDGQVNASALAVGDLTGDQRPDIVLLGDNGSLYLLRQRADHTFCEPEKIPYSGTPKAVDVVDINGDGRKDLLMVDWDSPAPFRFRLQNAAGQLGPEIYMKAKPVHAFSADNLDGNSNQFITTIAENSDRAEVLKFTHRPARVLSGTLRQGQFQVLPLLKTSAAQRGELWADLTGNGRPDLLVSDPDSGQISIYSQQPDGSLAPAQTFSTLAGVSQIAEANWHRGRRPEIFLLSQNEQAVGMTQFTKDGQFPFPTLLPIDGTPLIMTAGQLRRGAKPTLCLIVDKDGQRYLVTYDNKGRTRTQKLSASFIDTPVAMTVQDVNQDGLPDLVVLVPYDKVKMLLQRPDGSFDEEDVPYPGGGIAQPWMASAELDGRPELLLPGKNFVRAVVLEKERETLSFTNQPQWVFRVTDQINGATDDSQIVGATVVESGHDGGSAIFLLDAQYNQLTMCQRDKTGVWQVVQNVPLPVSDFNGLQTIALGDGQKHDVQSVAFLGQDALAWMPLGGMVWNLDSLDGYDTPVKDGYLDDVETGDLNGDGRKELVFLETTKHYLDIVGFDSHHKLTPAVRWQVFEEHTFRDDSEDSSEPREVLVANVTGHKDKKKDLVLVVHDRVLVYPQE
jgi:hypothetical protein